jgi:hypothetical protein
MNIYKIKLVIYIQENLFKNYMHYKNYITQHIFNSILNSIHEGVQNTSDGYQIRRISTIFSCNCINFQQKTKNLTLNSMCWGAKPI